MNAVRERKVVDGQGQPVVLGSELGRGAEGAVFAIPSRQDQVAKIYHSPMSRERAEKIRLLITLRTNSIASVTAWPIELLTHQTGEPIGLVMPRFDGRKDIHHLYSPKSRQADFQQADWRFLIRAAANTARAFIAVHDAGFVIGDVNHGSVLVAQDATVRLIDCDSFQVSAGGRSFLCEVGVETFTPPELQSRPFKGVVRTANHDNFGLAVMVFLILFMGRHPFAGRYVGAGEMPIPKAIEEGRFTYGSERAAAKMERPPGTPELSIVGSELAGFFERAFALQSTCGGRPSARDWAAALDRLEKNLRQCHANQSHWHLQSVGICPWCQMERTVGVSLFPLLVHRGSGVQLDLDSFWRQVEAIPHPGPAPEFSTPSIGPSSNAVALGVRLRIATAAGIAIAAGLIAFGMFGAQKGSGGWLFVAGIVAFFAVKHIFSSPSDVQKYRDLAQAADQRWRAADKEWCLRAGPEAFEDKKAAIAKARQELLNLPNVRLSKLSELKRNHRERQLKHFLDGFEIAVGKIPGIGPARVQTLESFGIETAADVAPKRIAAVPGFGPSLQGKLLAWRSGLEIQFVYDASKPVDPRDIAQVEQEVITQRKNLEAQLQKGAVELKQVHIKILAARQHMRPAVEAAHHEHVLAVANKKAAGA